MKKLVTIFWLLVFLGLPVGVLASEVKTIALPPLADAYADQNRPASKTGDYSTLYVAYDPNSKNAIGTLLTFDLTKIPAQATISRAKLRLYQQAAFADTGVSAVNLSVFLLNQSWQENNLNWNTRPTFSLPNDCKNQGYPIDKNKGYKELSLECLINYLRKPNHTNYGFYIVSPNNQRWTSMFYSKENSQYKPQLVVTYTIAGAVPPVTPAAESQPAPESPPPPAATPVAEATPAAVASPPTPASAVTPSPAPAPAPTTASQIESQLAQVLTAKNIKIAAIGLFALIAIKVLLLH